MKANKFHIQAEELREQDRLDEALDVLDLALNDYEENKNYEGFIQALQSRVLTFKHLFLLRNDQVFLDQAISDAREALAIAQEKKIKSMLGSCYFRLGEISMLSKNFQEAGDYYNLALENFSGTNCEKGDYRYHLGEALYKGGEKEKGVMLLEQGLAEIQNNRQEVESFLADVWESGCLMKLAEVNYKENNLPEAAKLLAEADKIINLNKKLVIRHRQFKELEKRLNA